MILFVNGAHGSIAKDLVRWPEELGIGRAAETIETTALMWLARKLRWIQETWSDLRSLRHIWKSISLSRSEKKNNLQEAI